MNDSNEFYLGKIYDPETRKLTDQRLMYDPADLTTHAVVVGMTGSGKTGLCIGLLEEAALNSIPALMIDPKGDITNTLLHFPDLRPQDFEPWVNPDSARRDGLTISQAAEAAAQNWQKGLADWGIGPERLRALERSAEFIVYTPGSDAGVPVSILASLQAPDVPWETHREVLREKISGTVTALLGLVGLGEADPVRSREHILLSNIFEHAWSNSHDLDLGELIMQVQSPPFEKLGVFDVNRFFPEKDRFELAMLLNNILAAPAFQTWIEGQPLNIPSLLYTPDGKPRHSVFYIAHLTDAERMFFVTLLFSAFEAWMRSQPGTPNLRALLYFDEIFGYLPPIGNPPSKPPLLRMLKQARAFGVGLVLVTQNPVDVDYKGLSNAGTWMIGKLQTDQDKQRLLDGLQGAAGGLDRATYDRLISGLGKRVFLMHNIHNPAPVLFGTRWAMNYLAGPLTRAQLPALKRASTAPFPSADVPNSVVPNAVVPNSASKPAQGEQDLGDFQAIHVRPATAPARKPVTQPATRPPLPAGIREIFLPLSLSFPQAVRAANRAVPAGTQAEEVFYRPALLAQASVRFLNRKYNLDYELKRSVLARDLDRRGMVRWEEHLSVPLDLTRLDGRPDPRARFATLEAPLTDAKILAALQKDFLEWVYRNSSVDVLANEGLKAYAGPDVSPEAFEKLCLQAARQQGEAEKQKVAEIYKKKLAALEMKLRREERDVAKDEDELSQRKQEETGTHLENIAGMFGLGRKRRLTTSLSKRRMTQQAKAELEESREEVEEVQQQIEALEAERDAALEEIERRWEEQASATSNITLAPLKKDVLLDLFGVAWLPHYVLTVDNGFLELPANQL